MRRKSVFAPLLLIALGGLLLLHNLRPELPVLELVLRYWPLILIAWGGFRLAEILLWATRSQPLPRSGITGGEWALVVLICLVGSGAGVARSHWPHARITMGGIEVFGDAFDFPISGMQATGPAPRVLIENLNGNVRVVGADAHAVEVKGRTTVRALDRQDAEEANRQCPLEVAAEGDRIIVRTNQERAGRGLRVLADLDITVPKAASVEGRGRYGDFDVSNIAGDVEIDSDNAGVRLTGIGGSGRIDLRRSDIIRIVNLKGAVDIKGRGQDIELEDIQGPVTINGSYSGELVLRNLAQTLQFQSRRTELRVGRIPGQLRIALGNLTANDLVGPVRLKSGSRDVRISGFSESLAIELERGDVELRPGKKPLARIDVQLGSGRIELAVPESAEFGLLAATDSGEIINRLGDAFSLETEGRRATLRGPEGKDATVRLKTGRGDIVVRESSAGDELAASDREGRRPADLKVERH